MSYHTARKYLVGNDGKTAIRYLGIAVGVFAFILGSHLLMSFLNYSPIPIGPPTAVVLIGVGFVAAILNAYWNNGVVISLALAISPPLALVTAVEVLELTSPRAPHWLLASWAIGIGVLVGGVGYLLGLAGAQTETANESSSG